MHPRQPLPLIWLLSDARNDGRLEETLTSMPRASGFVFRHYHLAEESRRRRYDALRDLASGLGHKVILADSEWDRLAQWGGDGLYCPPARIGGPPPAGTLWLASAHDSAEIQLAIARGASAIFLSPVFPTASHPGAPTLGVLGFRVLAQQSPVPVIALGGMNAARARELDWPRWGAIDGLGSTKVA